MEVRLDQLHDALKRKCKAGLMQSMLVRERFAGKRVWEAFVDVLELIGNPKVGRVYAWSSR